MNGIKKLGCFLSAAVKVLFGVLMIGVLFATVGIDKNNDNLYPNTVKLDNGIYYLAALLLLAGLLWLVFTRRKRTPADDLAPAARMTPRAYYGALAAMALAVAVLQCVVSRWMPYIDNYVSSDFKNTAEGAWEIARGGSLSGFSYFKTSPNNLNITILLSLVYRILPFRRATIVVGALLTNLSVALTSMAVYNATRRGGVALAVAGIGELLVALTWRAFLPYTDNYGMIFIALMLWLYTTKLRPEIKVPLIALQAAAACFIKITGAIFFLALAINGLVNWLCSEHRRLNFRRMALYAGCAAVLFGAVFGLQGPIRRSCGYEGGRYPKGWQYLFMVGQNTKTLGNVDKSNRTTRDEYIDEYKDIKAVNRAFLKKAFEFIGERGLWGNLAFYENKINVAYNDGYFNNLQSSSTKKMEKTFLFNVYIRSGRYYQIGATVLQILWDGILLTLIAYALCERAIARCGRMKAGPREGGALAAEAGTDPEGTASLVRCLRIGMLGVTLYTLCLEGRSKYLFMFLPLYLAAFGVMFDQMGRAAAWRLPSGGAPIRS